MKNIIVTLAAVVVSVLGVNAQTDSVTVTKHTDEMTDKVYLFPSATLFAIDKYDKKKRLIIRPSINVSTKELSLIVEPYKLGLCNENNTLIFKFSDGTKIKLKSWNSFDCKNSYFEITKKLKNKLRTLEIEKVYYMNGYSYESGTFPVDNKRYFIQLYKSLK